MHPLFPIFQAEPGTRLVVKVYHHGGSVPFSNRMHGFQNSTCKKNDETDPPLVSQARPTSTKEGKGMLNCSLEPRLSFPDFVSIRYFSKAVRQNAEWRAWVRG